MVGGENALFAQAMTLKRIPSQLAKTRSLGDLALWEELAQALRKIPCEVRHCVDKLLHHLW